MFYNVEDTCYIKLRELVAKVTEGVILEIGSKKGASAHAMASVASVPVYCIDLWDLTFEGDSRGFRHSNPANLRQFIENTKRLNIIWIKGLSGEIAKVWEKPIGLLFIDGDHSYEGCKTDYEGFAKYIIPGGYLVIHDYIPKSKTFRGVEMVIGEAKDSGLWEDWEVIGRTISARRALWQ